MKQLVIAVMLVGMTSSTALAQPQYTGGNRPVTLYAKGEVDTCSLAVISDPAPDGAVMVFPGDSTELDAVDYLADGKQVWICDGTEAGDMVGIVYSEEAGGDCEVSSPVEEDRYYVGPCSWGWVVSTWVQVEAG
mgnify:FL=1